MGIFLFLFMANNQGDTQVLLGRIYFDAMGTILTTESEAVLVKVADRMRAQPNIVVDVNGYAYSAGSSSENIELSKRMAEMVCDRLSATVEHGPVRTNVEGFGAEPAGRVRDKRSRVDIIVHQPDAILTSYTNDVRVQPPAMRPAWLTPSSNYYLYRGYKVTTGERSAARIIYPNKGMLRMGEDAMVIIHGIDPQHRERTDPGNIQLQDGNLTTMLDNLAQQPAAAVKTASGRALSAQINDTIVTEKFQDLVATYQSTTQLTDRADTSAVLVDVSVESNDTAALSSHAPESPELISPEPSEIMYSPDEIIFSWSPSAVISHLQVAEDSLFTEVSFDAYATGDSIITSLAENTYYWRMSGVNEDSTEGAFSAHQTFSVTTDTLAPELEIVIADGERSGKLTVTGSTEIDAELSINDEVIEKNADGSFSHPLADDFRGTFVTARAVDKAGNITEKTARIPSAPPFVMSTSGGMCAVRLEQADRTEWDFWYGVQFSRMLWRGASFSVRASLARSKGANDDGTYALDIVPVEIGLCKSFSIGRVSPFVTVRSGLAWRQTITQFRDAGNIVDEQALSIDPIAGIGGGVLCRVGGGWYVSVQADYTHIFSNVSGASSAETLTRFGLGIQDRL